MAFINVAEWTAENVAQWLQGLEDCILPYVHFFLNNQINGCRLLLLSPDDLVKLNVTKIGHQEIILDGVDLLKHLHYNFNSETLQSLALRLGCKSRSLYNQLKQEQEELQTNLNATGSQSSGVHQNTSSSNAISKTGTLRESKKHGSSHKNATKNHHLDQSNAKATNTLNRNKVSTKTLIAVCDILNAAKTFISWIDRYPFEGQEVYIPIRKTILKLSIELASTAQRDQFADRPNEIILTNCLTFAGLCDRIVQDLHDSLAIQPASLDVALIKKRSNEELGMHIHSSYSGIHIISGIKLPSATNNCGRVDEGDEIVQVNYRTVVGWQLKKLVDIMKEYQTELILTLKKRPKHNAAHLTLNKPFKLALREYPISAQNDGLPPMNGSMTLKSLKPRKPLPNEYSNEYTNIGELNGFSHLDAQMLNGSISKGKAAIRRRATISGSTSSVNTCGSVRVDDLLIKNTTSKLPTTTTSDIKQDNNNSQNVPFAKVQKVQPIQQQNEQQENIKQTVPKQLNSNNTTTFTVTSTANGKSIATVKSTNNINEKNNENVGVVLPNASRSNEQQNLENSQNSSISECTNESSNLNKPPPPIRQNKPTNSNNSSVNSNNPPPLREKPAIPMRPATLKSAPQQPITPPKLNRFVTLKQIEEENSQFFKQNPSSALCQLINNSNSSTNNNTIDKTSDNKECNNLLSGWLYTKREHFNTLLNANAKWSAKYVQLSTNYMLYAFRNELATKADLVINLAAFKVSPACECKSKENVFKTFNKHVIFLFASDTQPLMRQWVDTLRQLVSNCATTKPELLRISSNPDVACYSETEDEEDVIDDEMMLQNFANELVETTNNKQQEETIESKIDTELIKTDTTDNNNEMTNNEEELIKPIEITEDSLLQNSTPIKVINSDKDEQAIHSSNEDDEDKHNRRMMRLLNRRRQRYTSTAESCRDSSPSSTTSSASSSANTSSAGQAVLSRFAAISELKERLQKQAQEKLEQRRLAIASGKKMMYERSVSCMDASTISSFNNKLALANQANTTNNTPMKGSGLIRNKSGSQQSLLSPTTNDSFDLSLNNNKPTRPAKPSYMTQQNKVLPTIPPRPPKPQSISISKATITDNKFKQQQSNTDELNKRSQPLPQPRMSKNGLSAAVDDEQLADSLNNLNKENINLNNNSNNNNNNNKSTGESVLKKALQNGSSQVQKIVPNHKDNEYISNIIDELYNFTDESKTEQVISKVAIQPNNSASSTLKKENNVFDQPMNSSNFDNNFQQQNNFNNNNQFNQMNQLNEQQLHHLQSMLMSKDQNNEDEDDELDSYEDEECSDEEYSDEEDYDCMNKEYNMFNNNNNNHNNNNAQNVTNNFGQNMNENNNNLFSFGSSTSSQQMSNSDLSHNNNNSSNNVGFLAPGPNFLNSAPGVSSMNHHLDQNHHHNNHHHMNNISSHLLGNHQMDNHMRNDLSSSSNSNNYPTSSSTNSFNISPYSSISQSHNHASANDNLPLDGPFNNQIDQMNQPFGNQQTCLQSGLMNDEHLSDSSSGVSSVNLSLVLQAQTQQWYNKYKEENAEQLASLTPEEQEKFAEEFQTQFARQFTLHLLGLQQAQYQLQLAAAQQQNDPQFLQNLQQQQNMQLLSMGLNQMALGQQQQNNMQFNEMQNGLGNHQMNQFHQQMTNGLMRDHVDMNDLDDDELTDSDLCSLDEEEDSDDLEFDEEDLTDAGNNGGDKQKNGRQGQAYWSQYGQQRRYN